MADEKKKKGDPEEDTARIDEADAAEETSRIHPAPGQTKEPGTARIDLKAARPEADTEGTARIVLPGAKSETTRINPEADTVEYASEDRPATPPVAQPTATKKSQTQRISLSAARPAQTAPDSREGLRNQTMRVQVEDIAKSETSKIAAPKVTGKAGGTQRFDLAGDPEEEDAFKRHAPPGAEEPAKARPRTVKIKRKPAPAMPPTTPEAVDADTETVADAPAAPAAPAAESKSQTARIDLPPEAVTGRPKTIKIKRSAPTEPEKPEAPPAAPKAAPKKAPKTRAPKVAATAGPGPMYSLLAIAAVLIVCALIYMLLAQTFVPGLPFPGKLGV